LNRQKFKPRPRRDVDDVDQNTINPVEIFKERQRSKRALLFRPLFVYRQQEIKKQKLREERRKAMATQRLRSRCKK
jgi:hypothetical protein